MLPLIAAGIGAGIGYLTEEQQRKKRQEQIDNAIAALKSTMYDQAGMVRAEDRTGDVFNTQIADATNNSALGLGTVLNKDTFRAITGSKLLGQRASAINEQHNKMVDYNQKATLQIADLEGQSPTQDFTPTIAGGIMGYGAGESINKLAAPEGGDILDFLKKTPTSQELFPTPETNYNFDNIKLDSAMLSNIPNLPNTNNIPSFDVDQNTPWNDDPMFKKLKNKMSPKMFQMLTTQGM